jgi:outer membrane lipoprotein-sorting protein
MNDMRLGLDTLPPLPEWPAGCIEGRGGRTRPAQKKSFETSREYPNFSSGGTMIVRALILTIFSTASLFAAPPISELLEKIEANHKMTTDIKATVTLTQQKASQGIKQFDVLYYRRDADNSYLIVMTGPESEKGNGYLRVEDNFWMYRRNTRTFQHINRDESIAGSNAKGEDFERRAVTELYEGVKDSSGRETVTEEKLGQIPVYKFQVKAKVNDVDYPRKTFWLRIDNALLLKEEDFSSSGTLMQSAYFLKYTTINGRYIPVNQLFVDEFEKGNKTKLEISGISMDKLDNQIFTKAYLENLSK